MIELDEVLEIHEQLIKSFGGSSGVRDIHLLSSAIQRPFQTFDGEFVYQTILEQSSALVESILVNHPFVDGNKRTGYVLLRRLLIQNKLDIHASEDEKYSFIISIASGLSKFDEILNWLKENTIPINTI